MYSVDLKHAMSPKATADDSGQANSPADKLVERLQFHRNIRERQLVKDLKQVYFGNNTEPGNITLKANFKAIKLKNNVGVLNNESLNCNQLLVDIQTKNNCDYNLKFRRETLIDKVITHQKNVLTAWHSPRKSPKKSGIEMELAEFQEAGAQDDL